MNELKPVARVIPDHAHGEGVTKIAQIVEQELPAGAGLYIIPDTHRVVSVELLSELIDVCETERWPCVAEELRAIIDNKEQS